jgi:rubrerythrin
MPINAKELSQNNYKKFTDTISVLKAAYKSEMSAHEHYKVYSAMALEEDYKGIAYLFVAFAASELTHAQNYKKALSELGVELATLKITTTVENTKSNLRAASKKELIKIADTYPSFLEKLDKEAHKQAIKSCIWSWKSHQQHRELIEQVYKYSGWFFKKVAKKIESKNFDFHICGICGSTVDIKPELPCEICNQPVSNYRQIQKPI